MKPEELADGLEEVFAYDGLATDSPSAIWLADNYKDLLSALRRVEKLGELVDDLERRAASCCELKHATKDARDAHRLMGKEAAYLHAAEIARQALTGEA